MLTSQIKAVKVKKKNATKTVKGFGSYLTQGTAFEVAFGVVLGSAFTLLVSSLLKDIFYPLGGLIIRGLFGKSDLDDFLKISIGKSVFDFGNVILSVINFLIVAAIIYFLFIVPFKKTEKFTGQNTDAKQTNKLLSKILEALEKDK